MDWAERINRVMDYVEAHLTEEISEEEIAHLAACPYPMFQHGFAQAAAVSFSDYARPPRPSTAAPDSLWRLPPRTAPARTATFVKSWWRPVMWM